MEFGPMPQIGVDPDWSAAQRSDCARGKATQRVIQCHTPIGETRQRKRALKSSAYFKLLALFGSLSRQDAAAGYENKQRNENQNEADIGRVHDQAPAHPQGLAPAGAAFGRRGKKRHQ